MAILGLWLALPWFTPHPYTEIVPRNSTIPTQRRTDGCRVQSFEELCGHSILLGSQDSHVDRQANDGYGWLWIHSIFLSYSHDSIAFKKDHKYIYIGMIGIWLGLFLPMIFFQSIPIIPHVGPPFCQRRAPGCVARPARSSDVLPSEIVSGDPTTNRIAVVTVFGINMLIMVIYI